MSTLNTKFGSEVCKQIYSHVNIPHRYPCHHAATDYQDSKTIIVLPLAATDDNAA